MSRHHKGKSAEVAALCHLRLLPAAGLDSPEYPNTSPAASLLELLKADPPPGWAGRPREGRRRRRHMRGHARLGHFGATAQRPSALDDRRLDISGHYR
jgi:hypothetical protein